jgi:hypothetical protein
MPRWLRILLGPLPATLVLVPVLIAGGFGTALALVADIVSPERTPGGRWTAVAGTLPILLWVAAAVIGVLALWLAVLADSPAALRAGPVRWWLATGLLVGAAAAGRWLWLLAAGPHGYGAGTWGLWLILLAGPLVLALYYIGALLHD